MPVWIFVCSIRIDTTLFYFRITRPISLISSIPLVVGHATLHRSGSLRVGGGIRTLGTRWETSIWRPARSWQETSHPPWISSLLGENWANFLQGITSGGSEGGGSLSGVCYFNWISPKRIRNYCHLGDMFWELFESRVWTQRKCCL